MDSQIINVSENYRSGFLIRIKKINGKTTSIWIEVSSHNAELKTTFNDMNEIIDRLKTEG